MNRPILLLLAVIAAGAAGAGVSALLTHRGPTALPDDVARQIARLTDDVRQLGATCQRLEDDVRAMSLAPPLPVTGAAAPAEPPDAAAPAGVPAGTPPSPPGDSIDEKVRTAVAASREAELERIGERFSSMARRREIASLERFVQSTGLSPFQRDEMEKLLDRRREAIGAFFRTLFGGGEADPAEIREKVADVQRETDEALRSLLTPEQYEEWKKVDETAMRNPFGPPMGTPR